jgi:hypothetical protein
MLHLLGIDRKRFTYKFQGLGMRLTGVEAAHVLHDILIWSSTSCKNTCS